MLDLAAWPAAQRAGITGVFTDIDDTLTTEGAITADALEALGALHKAGIRVIAVTGRPIGWCEPFAREWPVDAVVAENGAVAWVPLPLPLASVFPPLPLGEGRGEGRPLQKLYQQPEATRAANATRLQQAAQRILREVPGAKLSTDSAGRETDIAIDHSEFTALPPARIAQVVRLMQDEGMNATVSSIHINGWFGDHDKLSGARWIAHELYGRDLDAEIDHWAYVGDSTNDVLMFEHFPHSVGVANIRRFEAQLTHKPRYITTGERGAGFSQVVRAILDARRCG